MVPEGYALPDGVHLMTKFTPRFVANLEAASDAEEVLDEDEDMREDALQAIARDVGIPAEREEQQVEEEEEEGISIDEVVNVRRNVPMEVARKVPEIQELPDARKVPETQELPDAWGVPETQEDQAEEVRRMRSDEDMDYIEEEDDDSSSR